MPRTRLVWHSRAFEAEPVSGKVRYQIARDGLCQRLASGLQFVAKTPDVFFVDGLRVRQGI